MITLAIETSTARGSVAIRAGDELVFDESFVAERNHSANLFPVLERAHHSVARIDQIGVGLGPGSYSGVRIGIAAAIGLRMRWNATMVGIASVAAFDTAAREYVAIGDARRESFYFSHIVDGLAVEGPLLCSETELHARLGRSLELPIYVSSALPQFRQVEVRFPSASRIVQLVATRRGIVGVDNLEPIYLRPPHITQPRK